MEQDKQIKLNELYTRAKSGEVIEKHELAFIPTELDREFYYKDLLNATLRFKKAYGLDTTEIEKILSGELEREMKIKELELELLKLKGE